MQLKIVKVDGNKNNQPDGWLFCALDSELCAAFDSAAFDHSTTGFRSNTSTEAVCTSAVTRMWLVSSFWHISTILLIFT